MLIVLVIIIVIVIIIDNSNNNRTSTTFDNKKTRIVGGSPFATVSKTAYNDNDILGIFKNKDTNLYDQNVARPKLILVAANASSITNTNTNSNNQLIHNISNNNRIPLLVLLSLTIDKKHQT